MKSTHTHVCMQRRYKIIQNQNKICVNIYIYLSVSVAAGQDGVMDLGVVKNVDFGRCDFLYSGAFWGWPLTKNSSTYIN